MIGISSFQSYKVTDHAIPNQFSLMKSFFDLSICSHSPNILECLEIKDFCMHLPAPDSSTCTRFPFLRLKSQVNTTNCTNCSQPPICLRLCLQTIQYTYYFHKSLTWNLFHIVRSIVHFFCFRSEIHKCFVAIQFLFVSSKKQRTK